MKKMAHIEAGALRKVGINDYDSIAAVYDEVMGNDIARIIFPPYEKVIRRVLDKKGSIRCLDIACGTGSFLRVLKKKFKNSVGCTGIDISTGQIRSARSIAEKEHLDISFKVGDVLITDFPKGMDIVTMNLDAMNHLRQPRDWKKLMSKVAGSLAPGGIFLFDINTQARLRDDLNDPEVIIKKDLTYVQVGVKLSMIGSFVLQQHIMQIFKKENGNIREYNAHIQQIAPSSAELFSLLKQAGFSAAKELPYSSAERAKHVFLKNRLFVFAQKQEP